MGRQDGLRTGVCGPGFERVRVTSLNANMGAGVHSVHAF
jgi:hypothetical protein